MKKKFYTAARDMEDIVEFSIEDTKPTLSKIGHFLRDESAIKCERVYSDAVVIITKPITGEVRSWFATPEARYKTVRNIIIYSAAQIALM